MRLGIPALLLFATSVLAWATDVPVSVYINGQKQHYDPPAIMRAGKSYVPLRQGAKSLGFSVEWLPAENGAKVCDEDSCLLIRKSEGIIVQGALFLPLRKMAEAFSAKVTWDSYDKAVIISKKR